MGGEGEIAEREHGGRRGADQLLKHFDFMTKMSEFSQISRLQEETQKVRVFYWNQFFSFLAML